MVAPNENDTITMPLIRAQPFPDGWQHGIHFSVFCLVHTIVSHIHMHKPQNIYCNILKCVKFNGISFSSVAEWLDNRGRNYMWPSLRYYPSVCLKGQRKLPLLPGGQSTSWIQWCVWQLRGNGLLNISISYTCNNRRTSLAWYQTNKHVAITVRDNNEMCLLCSPHRDCLLGNWVVTCPYNNRGSDVFCAAWSVPWLYKEDS